MTERVYFLVKQRLHAVIPVGAVQFHLLGAVGEIVLSPGGVIVPNLGGAKSAPEWLDVDKNGLSVKVATLPARDDVDFDFNEQLIVELYSK